MDFSFHIYNKMAADGVAMATDKLLKLHQNKKMQGAGTHSMQNIPEKMPVVVCVGSDLAIGDSLGPVCGSMLQYRTQGLNAFLYGTLSSPVTAKEIKHLRSFLRETHKNSPVIAIDAAVGDEGDIGLIKISNKPIQPGAGANKKLGSIGDLSIIGIVAERSLKSYALLNTTRLNLVYTMSEIIAESLSNLLWNSLAG